jgi:hypothetical protein
MGYENNNGLRKSMDGNAYGGGNNIFSQGNLPSYGGGVVNPQRGNLLNSGSSSKMGINKAQQQDDLRSQKQRAQLSNIMRQQDNRLNRGLQAANR